MDAFERRKQKKKDRIHQAAVELFKAFGFRKVSIGEIARRAGVSPTTIYNHFGTKEGLVREVIGRLLEETVHKYWAIMDSDRPFLEKLDLIIFDKTELSRQYEGELVQAVASNDPVMQEYVESMYREAVKRLVSFFQEGKRLGYINPDVSEEATLLYFDILRRGFLAHPEVFQSPEHNAALVRDLASLYMYGLMGKRHQSP